MFVFILLIYTTAIIQHVVKYYYGCHEFLVFRAFLTILRRCSSEELKESSTYANYKKFLLIPCQCHLVLINIVSVDLSDLINSFSTLQQQQNSLCKIPLQITFGNLHEKFECLI